MLEVQDSMGTPSKHQRSATDFGLDMCCSSFNAAAKTTPEDSGTNLPDTNVGQDGLELCNVLVPNEKPRDLPAKGADFWGEHPDATDLNTGRRALGKDTMDHLDDWDWLIANRKQVQRGLETAYGRMTPEAFEKFVKELTEKSDGKIYMEKGNGLLGSLNPLNPPGDQVVCCYLQRGGLYRDNNVLDSRQLTYSPTYVSGRKTHDSNK